MLLVQCWEKWSAMVNLCGLKSLRWPFQLQSLFPTIFCSLDIILYVFFLGSVCIEEFDHEVNLWNDIRRRIIWTMKFRFRELCVSPVRSGVQKVALSLLPWSSRDGPCRSNCILIFITWDLFGHICAVFVSYYSRFVMANVQERYQEDINRMYGDWSPIRGRKTDESCFWYFLVLPTRLLHKQPSWAVQW